MTHPSTHFSLSACALAVSLLVSACGGGEPTVPPDTVAPTVAITDSEAGATAAGPVTFTFTFSEDVGTSFTAEDITVTGGTAGTLAKASATSYTLVVTPMANATGAINVGVAAAKFTDLALNANTVAASAQQAYDTTTPAAPSGNTGTCTAAPCIDFSAANLAMTAFGALGAEIGNDPVDATNKVGKLTKVPASETWAGATIDPSGTGVNVVPAIGFATSKIITLRIYSPAAGETIMMKVENSGDGRVNMEKRATTTMSAAWETLTFDYTTPSAGSYDASKVYDRISVFPHFDSKVSVDSIYYIDELKYSAATGGGGGGTVDTTTISFDETTPPGFTGFGGAEDASIVADPGNAVNKVAKIVKAANAELWAGTTVWTATGDKIARIGFSDTAKTITARVWSPDAGIQVRMKVEDAADVTKTVETEATVTVAAGWQTLTFNFANPAAGTAALNLATTYNRMSLFFNFGKTGGEAGGAKTYYLDEIVYPASAGGGGGGCGTTEPTCAPATSIPAGSVVIYSDAGNVSSLDAFPVWGQVPPVVGSEPTIAGNKVLKYTFGALYQGIDWTPSPQDVSTKGMLHLDIWSADVASVKVSLIGGGSENGITKTLTPGSWNSIDIDLAQYTSPDKTKIIQMKLEPNVAGTIYVDNIHFYGTATGGGGGGGTFTGGIFASDYSGNLGAGTAKSDKGGTVGFFLDPRLFANKAFEDGSVCGSACNPGGVFNFYYGVGKLLPALTDAYFGGFVNAPGNTTADASAYAKVKLKFWGDAESWEKPNFTAQVDVLLQGPTNATCTNPSGRPELTKAVTAQKIGAGSDYIIPKTDFVLTESCGGAYTVNSVWSAVGAVVVRLSGTNLQYLNTVPSTPVSYPTFINIGPIAFIN